MTLLKAVALLLLFLTYISFTWAALFFFKVQDRGSRVGKKIVGTLGTLSMFILIFFSFKSVPHPKSIFTSIVLLSASVSLFWYSIIINHKTPLNFLNTGSVPTFLITRGPYSLVRHPFYISYFLGWFGGVVLSDSHFLSIIPIGMGLVYFKAAKKEESQYLSSNLAFEYKSYVSQTGMFFPRIIKRKNLNA